MSTDHNAADLAAIAARRRTYAEQIKPALIEQEGLNPEHAESVVSNLMGSISFDAAGAMFVTAPDGSESNVRAELERAKAEVPFAFADKAMKPVVHDFTTAAGRRAAESAANYAKATSDGNPSRISIRT